jgi:ATP-dependent helicase/DNAse subunit B
VKERIKMTDTIEREKKIGDILSSFSSSKTEAILNMIREDTLSGVHTFLIVPDQEALLAERLTLSMLPSSSQLELEVLGFSRLYNRVCREYGNICYAYLSKPMKYLIMWKALRELRGVLETIGADAKRDLANEELLLSAINELKINGVSADELDKSTIKIEKSSPELAAKIRDISAIYSTFELFTNEKYSDSADDLSRLYSILEEHNFFRNSFIYEAMGKFFAEIERPYKISRVFGFVCFAVEILKLYFLKILFIL